MQNFIYEFWNGNNSKCRLSASPHQDLEQSCANNLQLTKRTEECS